jgi:hypothetical protein
LIFNWSCEFFGPVNGCLCTLVCWHIGDFGKSSGTGFSWLHGTEVLVVELFGREICGYGDAEHRRVFVLVHVFGGVENVQLDQRFLEVCVSLVPLFNRRVL